MLELRGVTKQYLYGKRLFGVLDATFQDGEIIAVYGGEGSGKTSFLKTVAGLSDYDGRITLDGKEIAKKTNDVIMAFDDLAVFPLKSTYGNLAYPLKVRQMKRDVVCETTKAVAKEFALDGILKKKGFRLTKDERVKLSLARLFIRPARLVLFDEPRAGLDDENYRLALDKFRKIAKSGVVVIYATSDRRRALDGDRVVVLVDGDVKQIGTPEEIKNRPTSVWSAQVADENYNVAKATLTADNDRLNLVIHGEEEYTIDFTPRKNEVADGYLGRDLWCGWSGDIPDLSDYTLFDVAENSVMKG